jgi:hypothetical protein
VQHLSRKELDELNNQAIAANESNIEGDVVGALVPSGQGSPGARAVGFCRRMMPSRAEKVNDDEYNHEK